MPPKFPIKHLPRIYFSMHQCYVWTFAGKKWPCWIISSKAFHSHLNSQGTIGIRDQEVDCNSECDNGPLNSHPPCTLRLGQFMHDKLWNCLVKEIRLQSNWQYGPSTMNPWRWCSVLDGTVVDRRHLYLSLSVFRILYSYWYIQHLTDAH